MNRIFTWRDQERFAQLSGDYNPIHVDALAARRLLFGRPVVHGVHVLLWALDGWLQRHGVPICLSRVKAAFGSPVFLDEAVELVVTAVGAARVRLDVVKDGVNLMQATVEWCEGTESAALPDQALPERLPCKAWTAANIQHAHGELPIGVKYGARIRAISVCLSADSTSTACRDARSDADGWHGTSGGKFSVRRIDARRIGCLRRVFEPALFDG